MSAGTIEETILERAKAKREVDAKVIQAGIFNGLATADERRTMLASVFADGGRAAVPAGPSAASGEPAFAGVDGRELNELLARTPEELELFQRLDAAAPPRKGLLCDAELPAWVTAPASEAEEQPAKRRRAALGRGAYVVPDTSDEGDRCTSDDGGSDGGGGEVPEAPCDAGRGMAGGRGRGQGRGRGRGASGPKRRRRDYDEE